MPDSSVQPTLLFIPDISGFTQFVKQTDILHSQHIVEELLEILIDANEIGLQVSEIEGDAILFYRFGEAPTAAELLAQIQRMYVRFHANLRLYDTQRICQCGACSSAAALRLKFVVHYGDVAMKHVKEHAKLFGEDVITAHRLMKNQVPVDEYVLFTSRLMKACSTWVDIEQTSWSPPESGKDDYDVGTIEYCYIPLEPLLAHIPEPKIEDYTLDGATSRILEYEHPIEAPLEMVFNVLSDLSIRHKWMHALRGSDKLNGKITKNGSTHRCVMKGTDKDPSFVSHGFEYRDDVVTFTETNMRDGIVAVFRLRGVAPELTRLEVAYLIKQNAIKEFLFRMFAHKKLVKDTAADLTALNDYCKTLLSEGCQPPAQVVLRPTDA